MASSSQSKLMKKSKKEAAKVAKREKSNLISQLQGLLSEEESLVSRDDLLPSWDKGKTFSYEESSKNQEVAQLSSTGQKRETFSEDEIFISSGANIVEKPKQEVGIIKEETQEISSQPNIVKCSEAGEYEAVITRELNVEVEPEKRKWIYRCKGHKEEKKFHNDEIAVEYQQKKIKLLEKKPEISPDYKVTITSSSTFGVNRVKSKWRHLDGTNCKKSTKVLKTVSDREEKDHWNSDNPRLLTFLEQEPTCHLLFSQELQGPGERLINGEPIFRDRWKEKLHYKCHGLPNQKCQTYRDQGVVLVEKKCIKEDPFGECVLWEKTYDLNKMRPSQKTDIVFVDQELYGFDEELPSVEKNREFGEVAASFSILSELEQDLQNTNTDASKANAEIFKGEAFECTRSLIHGILYDCCKKMDGIAIAAHLADCSPEEKCLSKHRYDGKCHFIGTKRSQLETKQVYCCFPTKLARIVHEEGRKQLRYTWGSAARPNCRGFSPEQFRKINFSKLDLTELLDDLKIDQKELMKKLTLDPNKIMNEMQEFKAQNERSLS
ncbi:MAG: conjugal transfer protein TraN (plasmid) [Candidatus Algichlamydia australiensis]|nr:conjugal transfer protein TraN [Chlamydiales bacterium]